MSDKPRELCIPRNYQQDSLEEIVEMQTLGHAYDWYIEKSYADKWKDKYYDKCGELVKLDQEMDKLESMNKDMRSTMIGFKELNKLQKFYLDAAEDANNKLTAALEVAEAALEYYGMGPDGKKSFEALKTIEELMNG